MRETRDPLNPSGQIDPDAQANGAGDAAAILMEVMDPLVDSALAGLKWAMVGVLPEDMTAEQALMDFDMDHMVVDGAELIASGISQGMFAHIFVRMLIKLGMTKTQAMERWQELREAETV